MDIAPEEPKVRPHQANSDNAIGEAPEAEATERGDGTENADIDSVVVGALSRTEATPCPACLREKRGQRLTEAADLEGQACPRCAGVFLPTAGSDRLLGELLGLDRAALVDLADGFGGHRHRCPACHGRMRSLVIRGAQLDLCFHCAGLWLPFRALERLSDGRFTSPTTPAPVLARIKPPAHHVRLDRRRPLAVAVGDVVFAISAAVVVAGFLGLGPGAFLSGGLGTLTAFYLRRRKTLDVFPRAKRVLAGRRFLPAVADDEAATTLDDETFLVVRAAGPLHWHLHYEDSCGRLMAPLGLGRRQALVRRGQRLAPKLGATLCTPRRGPHAVSEGGDRVDDVEARAAAILAGVAGDLPTLLRSEAGPSHTLSYGFRQSGRTVLTLKNAVPARGDERGFTRLRLHYVLEAKDGVRARFHDDGSGVVVVVDIDGVVVATITGAIASATGVVTATAPRGGPRLHAVGGPIGPVFVLDDRGRRVATIRAVEGAAVMHPEVGLRNKSTEASLLWLLASVLTLGAPEG